METLFFMICVVLFLIAILSGAVTIIAIVDWSDKGQDIFRSHWKRLIPVSILCASSLLCFRLFQEEYTATALIKTPMVYTQIGGYKINGFYLEDKFMPVCNGGNINEIFQKNRKDKDIPEVLNFKSALCYSDTLYIYKITKKNGLGVPLSSRYRVYGSRNRNYDLELAMNGNGPRPTKEKTK